MKHQNSLCELTVISSNFHSNILSQDYIKCTFYKNIQFPLSLHSLSKLIARSSYPYPIEILMSPPLEIYFPFDKPISSTSLVGSTPGNNTKNKGVFAELSE